MGGKRHKKKMSSVLPVTLIAAAVLIMSIWYTKNLETQTGSFEYVRRAEELSDKGKLEAAIKYLNKAYESSPENEVIAAKLRNAYFEFGRSLSESGDIDKAIECMIRAYAVMPGHSSAERMAFAYAEKASEKLRSGDMAGARDNFDSALEAAAPYASSSRNLSIFLFNKAVEDYRSGKDVLSIIFLKEASLACDDARTFEFLGDIYYNRAELDDARFYFAKSLSLDPGLSSVRGKLKKVIIDMRLAKERGVVKSPHFNIMYTKDRPVDTSFVQSVLEKCYFEVGDDFKYFPDSRTSIVFYPQDDFQKMFATPSGTRAIYDGNIRVPLPTEKLSDSELAQYIRHEYTHAVISAKTKNNCPTWLSEGLAVWESYKESPGAIDKAMTDNVDLESCRMEKLKKAFDHKSETESELAADYILSYSAVKYMLDAWGMAGLNKLLGRIHDGEHFINAVDDEFLISEKDFEKRWKSYLMDKKGRMPVL